MNTERICPGCHKALPPDVPLGLCPECLIKAGFPTSSEDQPARFVPPTVEDIAKLFPQLEILSFIGKGGMGAVYKARQPALDRFIALKVLPPAVANDPGFAERFNREARALARLNHPNIVAIHDFGMVAQVAISPQPGEAPAPLHYLLMEFVDGTNLREIEQAEKLSPEQALAIVPQICDALQYAHNEGIVHRDIKPENLLLDKKGRLKITDFGIAKIIGVPGGKASLTGAKDVVGTPHYMAPEQIEKPQTVDHRADIYSLGVVFYEMLTGELPLGKFAPPSKKVQVDVRLDEVVLQTLEKEPERRYQQASQVKTDVQNIATTAAPAATAFAAGTPQAGSASADRAASDKIILPAFLLAFFFGIFGAHRFYVGKIRTGLLQLGMLGVGFFLTIAFAISLNHHYRGFIFVILLLALIGSCLLLWVSPVWATIDWILLVCKVFTDGQGRRITQWLHGSSAISQPEMKLPGGTTPAPPKMDGPGSQTAAGSGGSPPPMSPLPGAQFSASPNAMITAPAVALMIAGGLKMLGLFQIFLLFGGASHWLHSFVPGMNTFLLGPVPALILFDTGFKTAAGALMLFGGYMMFRRQGYGWAVAAGIFSILACSLISFPIGIWALIVLAREDVRTTFNNSTPGLPASPAANRSWPIPLLVIAVLVLLLAVVASLGFAAIRIWHMNDFPTLGGGKPMFNNQLMPLSPQPNLENPLTNIRSVFIGVGLWLKSRF